MVTKCDSQSKKNNSVNLYAGIFDNKSFRRGGSSGSHCASRSDSDRWQNDANTSDRSLPVYLSGEAVRDNYATTGLEHLFATTDDIALKRNCQPHVSCGQGSLPYGARLYWDARKELCEDGAELKASSGVSAAEVNQRDNAIKSLNKKHSIHSGKTILESGAGPDRTEYMGCHSNADHNCHEGTFLHFGKNLRGNGHFPAQQVWQGDDEDSSDNVELVAADLPGKPCRKEVDVYCVDDYCVSMNTVSQFDGTSSGSLQTAELLDTSSSSASNHDICRVERTLSFTAITKDLTMMEQEDVSMSYPFSFQGSNVDTIATGTVPGFQCEGMNGKLSPGSDNSQADPHHFVLPIQNMINEDSMSSSGNNSLVDGLKSEVVENERHTKDSSKLHVFRPSRTQCSQEMGCTGVTKTSKSGEHERSVRSDTNGLAWKVSPSRGRSVLASPTRIGETISLDSLSSHGGSSSSGSPLAPEALKEGRISSPGDISMSKGSPYSESSRSMGSITGYEIAVNALLSPTSSNENAGQHWHSNGRRSDEMTFSKGTQPEDVRLLMRAAMVMLLKRALATSDSEHIKNAGNEYYKAGHFLEALTLYDKAVALCPNSAVYRCNRAAALTGLERLGEAVKECEEAIRLDPSYARARQRAASLYIRLGMVESARQHLHGAGQDTNLIEVQRLQVIEKHLSRCIEARKLGDWHNVIKESDAAVVAGADSAPQIFGFKSEALLRLQKLQHANSVCTVAQKIESSLIDSSIGSPNAYLCLTRAQVHMALGRFDEAVLAAEAGARIEPNNAIAAALLRKARTVAQARAAGNGFFNAGRLFEALASYAEGLESDPTNAVLLCNRAACRLKLGQWEKAVEDCDAVLKAQPNYTKARLRRASCLTKLERWEDALHDYEALKREMPGNSDVDRALFDVQVAMKKSRGQEIRGMKFGGDVEEVTSEEQFREAVGSAGLSVVQFMTRWSDRCQELSPFIDDLCRRHPCVNFVKVDVEELPYLARIESITFIPTFKIYKDGQKLKEIVGPSHQSLEYAVSHYSL
ncbi:hypothetical protein GOP47_0009221 [Adiantum capillus-veneris]|uniref:Thioredoxin domain-containing protein n=1 Tax=Adiantum capillus-veneris TaxID=13818 RepID=A0A9D4ZJG2_ADICA|nr:hypothetical protein GOP47_0009221 [Adiantum capillus-veneris]